MKISLIGFMGSGKSSVARILGKLLDKEVLEMDQEILKRNDFQSMAELFAQGGEILLREQEISLAHELQEKDNIVVSCGGGVVMNKIVIDYLKKNHGIVIFLDSTFDELEKRIQKDGTPRPLFQDREQAQKLYEFRLPLYRAYAHIIVNTDGKSTSTLATEIIQLLKQYEH